MDDTVKVIEVTDADIAFGARSMQLLPPYEQIPEEYKKGHTFWNKFIEDWFFDGIQDVQWTPHGGVDSTKAIRHLKAIMVSFEPKHEHKMAGCAYLACNFFEKITYTRVEKDVRR